MESPSPVITHTDKSGLANLAPDATAGALHEWNGSRMYSYNTEID